MSTLKYAFFVGCITPLRYPGIEVATRAVMKKLGVELQDIEGASCCPAPGIFPKLNKKIWLATGARNLCLAEKMGLDILTVCNGCLMTLSKVNDSLKVNPVMMKEANTILSYIGMRFEGKIEVRHLIDVLYEDVGVERMKKRIPVPLKNFRVAPFYGCHYFSYHAKKAGCGPVKESRILEKLVQATGAQSVEYPGKTQCCGAGEGIKSASNALSYEIMRQKIMNIAKANVNCIVDICPFCHLQLDRGQREIKEEFREYFEIPVLHCSQLLGLALGMTQAELGLNYQGARLK